MQGASKDDIVPVLYRQTYRQKPTEQQTNQQTPQFRATIDRAKISHTSMPVFIRTVQV